MLSFFILTFCLGLLLGAVQQASVPAGASITLPHHPASASNREDTERTDTFRIDTVMPQQPFEMCCRLADAIVRAQVRSVRHMFPGGRLVGRKIEVDVLETIKGEIFSHRTILLPDRSVDEIPSEENLVLREGQETILFLTKSPDGHQAGILGLSAGAYEVDRREVGAPWVHGLNTWPGGEALDDFSARIRAQLF